MRLDKFLCDRNIGTRSQVKTYIRKGLVTVNGKIATAVDLKIDEASDIVTYQGCQLHSQGYVYYMLNKPQGVVSATQDNTAKTVVELLKDCNLPRHGIFPVGRLDKDTEGLLLLTDDGELAHRLLSPKRHVDKTYLVTAEHPISPEDIERLEQGVDIGDEQITRPAKVVPETDFIFYLTIHEGRYHQIKRMLQAVNNRVAALKRITFGGITLDEGLKPGEYRELTEQEVDKLHEA
ncbi:MAG: rRNA pseudouridine synthase [Acetatifactor sp.]|nr:rRNA pseudouridine synthase [Acetatifactor sp.]